MMRDLSTIEINWSVALALLLAFGLLIFQLWLQR